MNYSPPKSIPAGAWTSDEVEAWDELVAQGYRRLQTRVAQYEIPEFEAAPAQDLVVAFRLPGVVKNRTAGGLYIPDTLAREEVYSVGVLLWGGLEALDVLDSHGIFLGDMVTFGRFAGDEEGAHRVQEAIANAGRKATSPEEYSSAVAGAYEEHKQTSKVLKMKVSEIQNSVDLKDRLLGETPTMRIVREISSKGAVHNYRPIVENILKRAA